MLSFSDKIGLLRIIGCILVIALSPIILVESLIVALLVRLKLGSPVIYSHICSGNLGRCFHIRKFRSMSNRCDHEGNLLPHTEKLTNFGRRIRAIFLDELPSFWQILTGAIALVGPRPLLHTAVSTLKLGQLRQQVLPGFTGLAQVSVNARLSEDQKFALDCYYISNRTFLLDLSIVLKTFKVITTSETRDETTISRAIEYCNQWQTKQPLSVSIIPLKKVSK